MNLTNLNMFRYVLMAAVFVSASASNAQMNSTDTRRSGRGIDAQEVEIRKGSSGDKIRGEVDSSGDFRGRDRDGNRYKGSIDSDGYGKLKDSDGNTIKVKPRY